MGQEIERKFLLKSDAWRKGAVGQRIVQGYLLNELEKSVRVRIYGPQGFLTVKGGSKGISRLEFEYEIPLADAEALVSQLCDATIEKTRYRVQHGTHTWEIDVFGGENEGLVVAELELETEDEAFEQPAWIGAEVTSDPRYFNASLVRQPFKRWR